METERNALRGSMDVSYKNAQREVSEGKNNLSAIHIHTIIHTFTIPPPPPLLVIVMVVTGSYKTIDERRRGMYLFWASDSLQ